MTEQELNNWWLTLEYYMNKYLEILDIGKIIPIIEKHKPIK